MGAIRLVTATNVPECWVSPPVSLGPDPPAHWDGVLPLPCATREAFPTSLWGASRTKVHNHGDAWEQVP